jgi:hypothetical protein
MPKKCSLAWLAAQGLTLGKTRPEELAVYIVEQFKKYCKQ